MPRVSRLKTSDTKFSIYSDPEGVKTSDTEFSKYSDAEVVKSSDAEGVKTSDAKFVKFSALFKNPTPIQVASLIGDECTNQAGQLYT